MTTDRQFSFPGGDVGRQRLVESRENLKQALQQMQRGLQTPGARRGRIWALGMIDDLRVLTEAFENHAALSEGAMEDLVEASPQLDHVVVQLEEEHDRITILLGEELFRLRRNPSSPETEWIKEMRADIDATMRALLDHQEREACFVQDSRDIETGGGD